jgi:oligoendopeptidase F
MRLFKKRVTKDELEKAKHDLELYIKTVNLSLKNNIESLSEKIMNKEDEHRKFIEALQKRIDNKEHNFEWDTKEKIDSLYERLKEYQKKIADEIKTVEHTVNALNEQVYSPLGGTNIETLFEQLKITNRKIDALSNYLGLEEKKHTNIFYFEKREEK